jgi:hypothetical protein
MIFSLKITFLEAFCYMMIEKKIHLYSTFNKNFKIIFWGKLYIYVGYGIIKKKSEKIV